MRYSDNHLTRPARMTDESFECVGSIRHRCACYCPETTMGVMAAHKLNEQELATSLKQLSAWELKNSKLHREFKFSDFAHAFGFMTTAAVLIEKMNRHPEWF